MDFNEPKPLPDRRKQQIIYLRPSLKDEIDRKRAATQETRSVWIEKAIMAALRKKP